MADHRRRAGRYNRTHEARRLERDLARRFTLAAGHAWINVTADDYRGGWMVEWQDGPTVDLVRLAVAELAGPGLTETIQRGKLRYWRSISARAWAVLLLAAAAADDPIDLEQAGVHWRAEERLRVTPWPQRATTDEQDAAATELLRLAGAGKDARGQVSEYDLARLLDQHGYAAIAAGAARVAIEDSAGVVRLSDYAAGRRSRSKRRP